MSEGRQMAEAVLQLAVTYRTIIMPLISATEKRLDLDKDMRDRISKLMVMQMDPRVKVTPAKKKDDA